MICRNLKINGRRTSLRMEQDIWDALYDVAKRNDMTPSELASEIDRHRGDSSMTGALRIYVLRHYRNLLRQITEYEESIRPMNRVADPPNQPVMVVTQGALS